jgi:hypothetical protein
MFPHAASIGGCLVLALLNEKDRIAYTGFRIAQPSLSQIIPPQLGSVHPAQVTRSDHPDQVTRSDHPAMVHVLLDNSPWD